MKKTITAFSVLLLTNMAFAQVGAKEIKKHIKDQYAGDMSISVQSLTTLNNALTSWNMTSYMTTGSIYLQPGKASEVSCSIQILSKNNKTEITVTNGDNIELGLKSRSLKLLLNTKSRLVETLRMGLENSIATYDLVTLVNNQTRVVKETDPRLEISSGEGLLTVQLSQNDDAIYCTVTPRN